MCLTALPLVLLALIGVGGSSLSGFILLFFSYLRNRRVLSQDAPARGRDGKELSMLPTWSRGKKSAPDTGEDEAQLKSRSRFQVDLKERKLDIAVVSGVDNAVGDLLNGDVVCQRVEGPYLFLRVQEGLELVG